ncbi:MAG TPA: type II toxin-antitoxin system HicB family antitoxin [Trueperaceae bacterium]|nr:type II toxin-antitoxin system HicB family antitoxin [Trueperaceae bacterium]
MTSPEYRYEVIIRWSKEDRAYVAVVPDLPGCMADGSTYGEAVENVQLVMRQWIETTLELGRPLPEPTARLLHT